jgi:hypothetical protein
VTGRRLAGLEGSFAVAAGELGMCSAAWLFSQVLLEQGGAELLRQARDELGREYPILDAIAERTLAGAAPPRPDPAPLLAAIGQPRRVVVVGIETLFLDALLPRLDGVKVALLRHGPFDVDWQRVLDNFGGRVAATDLDDFQTWAGPRSVLLCFAYASHGHGAFVLPSWERVVGADVRTQFRALVAWDVLAGPLLVYPRWLVEVSLDAFTHVVSAR